MIYISDFRVKMGSAYLIVFGLFLIPFLSPVVSSPAVVIVQATSFANECVELQNRSFSVKLVAMGS